MPPFFSPTRHAAYVWTNRAIEFLWLAVVVLVPLVFLGRNHGEWSSVIGSFELPKITLLRTLVGVMLLLWMAKGALIGRVPLEPSKGLLAALRRPKTWLSEAFHWTTGEPSRLLALCVAIFLGSTLLSTALSGSFRASMWGDVPGQDSYSAFTVVSYVALFAVMATHLKTRWQLFRVLGALVLVGVLLGGYAVAQHYGADFWSLQEPINASRASSTVGGPIFAAAVLLMTIGASITAAAIFLRPGDTLRRTAWVLGLFSAALTVQFLGITFTLARGPWGAAAVTIALFLVLAVILTGARTMARSVLALAVAGVLTVAVVQLVPEDQAGGPTDSGPSFGKEEVGPRVVSTGTQLAGGGISGRIEVWETSLTLMLERPWIDQDKLAVSSLRPLIGYGPDLFRSTYLLESPAGRGDALPGEPAHAHNYFVHQAVELGFLGLGAAVALFLVPFLIIARRIQTGRRTLPSYQKLILCGIFAILAGRLLDQLVGVARVSDLAIWWVLLAVLAGALLISQKEESPGPRLSGEKPVDPTPAGNAGPGPREGAVRIRTVTSLLIIIVAVLGIGSLVWLKNVNYLRAGFLADKSAEQFRNGEVQSALGSMDRAIELAPDVSTYYGQRSVVAAGYKKDGTTVKEAAVSPGDSQTLAARIKLGEKAHSLALQWSDHRPVQFRSRLALADSTWWLGTLTEDPRLVEKGLGLYQDALSAVPNSFILRIQFAYRLIASGEPEAALMVLDGSVAITSAISGGSTESADALRLKGTLYRELERYPEAIVALDESIRLGPFSAHSYHARALTYRLLGQPLRVLADLDDALRVAEDFTEGYLLRGTVYGELNRVQSAVDDFTSALQLDPQSTYAYNGRGLFHALLGESDQAISDFSQAIELDPELAAAYNNRGLVYRDLGDVLVAIQDFDQAIELDPELASAYYNRALAHIITNNDREAEADAAQALALGLDPVSLSQTMEAMKRSRDQ